MQDVFSLAQEVIGTYSASIKKDLGITVSCAYVVSKEVITPFGTPTQVTHGQMFHTIHHSGMFSPVTDISDIKIVLYPQGIKSAWPFATKEELKVIMINTLAHELRHVHQAVSSIGKAYSPDLGFALMSVDTYKADPKEKDAYQYADKYITRLGYDTMSQIKKKVTKRIGLVGLIGYAAVGIGLVLASKKKRK